MLEQISQKEARKRGLELHPDKTKIMSDTTKKSGRGKEHPARAGEVHIEILPYEANLKYLGPQISFNKPQEVEIKNRVQAA